MSIIKLFHRIKPNPPPEEADTIRVFAMIEGYDRLFRRSTTVEEFLADCEECRMKEELEYFLMEAGINSDVTMSAMMDVTRYVDEVACSLSTNYPPGSALAVCMVIRHTSQIEEAIRVSFNETSNFGFKPARKLVVKSLPRKIYEEISSTGETCTICFEEFNNGGRLVTLPCGHEFDDECAVKWFETSHYCPLCRYMLPCEDQ